MKGRIIPLHGDAHRELGELLPWYVTGRLDAPERARVEAHLNACAECRDEVRFQRRLQSEVAHLPLDVEQGWARMRLRLEQEEVPRWRRLAAGFSWRRAAVFGWTAAAGLALGLVVSMTPPLRPAGYHALGSPPASQSGNVVVIFRPQATEQQMRETLTATGARLTDGPTAAGGYVLRTPPAGRAAVLATLRASRQVVLAEPIGASGP